MDLAHTRTLRGHVGAVLCARYTKDGTYAVTCGADRSVKLWNPKREAPTTGALLIKTYEGPHSKEVSSVAVADDSARASRPGRAATRRRSCGAWPRRRRPGAEGHTSRVNCAAFCGPGHCVLATGSYDQTVKLWDLRSQRARAPDHRGLQGQRDGDRRRGAQRRGGPEAAQRPRRGARARVGRRAADGTARFDLRKGRVHEDALGVPVTSVALSRDGACVAASCLDSSARLLELDSGAQLNLYTGHARTAIITENQEFVSSNREIYRQTINNV
ncbi:RNA splicing protein [Aureococcus anophagefferens]|uniref:RNA splicing protein n=1 Tax=Aureococcus anophagefferens TaxID=44056 RepID=A0ABR1GBC4_AURAN